MKAVTLWQPWASLIAFGLKTIETRSWGTRYRGPLLIHAAKRRPTFEDMRVVVDNIDAWNSWGAAGLIDLDSVVYPGPLGVVVAVVDLAECLPIVQSMSDDDLKWTMDRTDGRRLVDPGPTQYTGLGTPLYGLRVIETRTEISEQDGHASWVSESFDGLEHQRPYGDFTHGRLAWMLAGIRPLDEPIPAKGMQGLWTPTPDTVAEVHDQLGVPSWA